MKSTLKKALKHVLGHDLWIRTETSLPTRFYGSRYGGWSVLADSVGQDSVVYSFGIGEDVSFDLELIRSTGCVVHGFDPTPKSLAWVESNIEEPRFQMHPWALATEDGTLTRWLPDNPEHVSASLVSAARRSQQSFDAECRGLESVMRELGHDAIDVLKMDIEGAEYGVLESLAKSKVLDQVSQLLVEFHHRMDGFAKQQTLNAIRQLRTCGFRVAWVSEVGPRGPFLSATS